MKRLALLLTAAILSASVVLSGCTTEKKDTTKEDIKNPAQNPPAVENIATDAPGLFAQVEKEVEGIEPKKDLDKEIVATVDGVPFSASALKYAVFVSSSYPEEERDAEFEKFFKYNAATWLYASEIGVEAPTEYIDNLKATRDTYASMYGESYESMFDPITPYYYYFYDVQNSMFANTFYKLEEDANSDFMKELTEEVSSTFMEDENYVRAKHILVMFPQGEGENGEVTDAQKADALAKATDIYNQAAAITDPAEFDALVTTYNEDPGMMSSPGGYCFTTGEMVEPFETAAFALEDFAISEPVETSYGYHILQKLPKDYDGIESTNLYTSTLYYNIAAQKLEALIGEKAEGCTIVRADNFEERYNEFKAEYDAMMAEQESGLETENTETDSENSAQDTAE